MWNELDVRCSIGEIAQNMLVSILQKTAMSIENMQLERARHLE